MSKRLILYDALSSLYRSFYAIKGLSSASGIPTNALFGFVRAIEQVIKTWEPSHLVVAFDGGLPAERLELIEDYKAQRPPMPDDLKKQLPMVEEFLNTSRIHWVKIKDVEADDIMATLAKRSYDYFDEILIATSDKDMFQLVDEKVRIVPTTGAREIMDADAVLKKTGVKPSQIPSWLAMVGDSSDNIKGLPGIGVKTAAKLIDQYGSVEAIYQNINSICGDKVRGSLSENRHVLERNLKVVYLNQSVNYDINIDQMALKKADISELIRFYEKYEFGSLAGKLRGGDLFGDKL